jgi:hypothetical protein
LRYREWQALLIRANEVSAFDIDDIDDEGKVILVEDEDDNEDTKPASRRKGLTRAAKPRSTGRRAGGG